MFRSKGDDGTEVNSELYGYVNGLTGDALAQCRTERGKVFIKAINERYGSSFSPSGSSPGWAACLAINKYNARYEDIVTLAALLLG